MKRLIFSILMVTGSIHAVDDIWTSIKMSPCFHKLTPYGNKMWTPVTTGLMEIDITDKSWKYHTAADGMTGSGINDIAADRNGTIWVASDHGVFSYTGTAWKHHTAAALVYPQIFTSVAVDSSGTVWAGSGNGLLRFKSGTWTLVTIDGGSGYNQIKDLCVNKNGNLLVANLEGLSVYLSGVRWDHYYSDPNGDMGYWDMYSVNLEADGKVYVASEYSMGMYISGTGLRDYPLPPGMNYPDHICHMVERGGTEWFGQNFDSRSDGGLFYKNVSSWVAYAPDDGIYGTYVQAIREDRLGNVWVGSQISRAGQGEKELYGLARFSSGTWDTVLIQGGLGDNSIRSITVDRDNRKWFATVRGFTGLLGHDWEGYNVSDWVYNRNTSVQDLAIDLDGSIWFVNTGYPLEYTGTRWIDHQRELPYIGGNSLRNVAVTSDNRVWFGSDMGLVENNRIAWSKHTTTDGMPHNNIRSLRAFPDTSLWVGTDKGAAVIKKDSLGTFTTADGLVNNMVNDVDIDSTGIIWIATGGGISSFDGQTWTSYDTLDGLPNNSASCLAVDKDNNVWAGFASSGWGHYDGGFAKFNGSGWVSYDSTDFRDLYSVSCMAVDHDNSIWIGLSNKGIIRFIDKGGKMSVNDRYGSTLPERNIPYRPVTIARGMNTLILYMPRTGFCRIRLFSPDGTELSEPCSGIISQGRHTISYEAGPERILIYSLEQENGITSMGTLTRF